MPWQTETADRESVTHIYVKPEPVVEPHRPTVRSYEVEDRFTLPVFSSHGMRSFTAPHLVPRTPIAPPTFVPPSGSQVAVVRQPAYEPSAAEAQTHAVRRTPATNLAGIGYAAICVVVGVILGGLFAFSGSGPAPVAAPVVTSRPAAAKILPPAPIVTPIDPAPAKARQLAPIVTPIEVAP